MATDPPSGPRPAPVVLRIKLRYDDVESMVQRFAPNIGKSGLFLPTKSLQPVGTEVKFELRIADDTPVLVGLGRVKAAKPPDPAAPRAAFGMAIELMRVTRESRDVILRMLERRRQLSLPEVGVPMPADIDAARRSEVVDTQVKDTASPAVPAPFANLDRGPSDALLTAPRRPSRPIAIARLHIVEPLGPEPARKKRLAVHEVIERASGPIISVVSVPGLDDDVDIGKALARARALAGDDLDAELDALREVSAAPLEISIEAASAELARALGGKAVDRSARWAKPPSVVLAEPVAVAQVPDRMPSALEGSEVLSADTAVEAPDPPSFSAVASTLVDEEHSGPLHVAPKFDPDVLTAPAPPPLIHDDVDPAAFDARENSVSEIEPDQIADEVHQLEEDDFEEVEQTQLGGMPRADTGFDGTATYVTLPGEIASLERSLDAQLAEADADDLGISGAYAMPVEPTPDDAPEQVEEEIDDFEILAEADAEDADLLAAHGEAEASGSHEVEVTRRTSEAERPHSEADLDPRPSQVDFVSRLELSDEFEAAPEPEPANARPFSDRHASISELDPQLRELDPRRASAGHALAAFDDLEPSAYQRTPFDEPASFRDAPVPGPEEIDGDSQQYTIAGDLPPADAVFDAPHTGFAGHRAYAEDARGFDESDIEANLPPLRRAKQPSQPRGERAVPAPAPGDEGYDLETVLEALDVDLDDLSVPHELPAARERPDMRPASHKRASSQRGAHPQRATTDEGVLIQFEDDE